MANEFNIKLISLFLLFVLAVYLWYKSKDIDRQESYYHFFLYLITAYMPVIYVALSPLFAIILSYKVSFEMFLTILFSVYLIAFVLGFGLVAFFAKKNMFGMFSKENLDSLREMKKYKNNG
jgi:hypothetical protein